MADGGPTGGGVPAASYLKVGLSMAGVVLAILAWRFVHPIVGVIVGVLFIGGTGWNVLANLLLRPFATRVARREAAVLQDRTGIPAAQIYREMRRWNLTPGEWAVRRADLHPISYEPIKAEPAAIEFWERVRIDPQKPPPAPTALHRLAELHHDLLARVSGEPLLPTEAREASRVLVALHDLGSRVDSEWLNAQLSDVREPDAAPRTQAEWNDWQDRSVDRRSELYPPP